MYRNTTLASVMYLLISLLNYEFVTNYQTQVFPLCQLLIVYGTRCSQHISTILVNVTHSSSEYFIVYTKQETHLSFKKFLLVYDHLIIQVEKIKFFFLLSTFMALSFKPIISLINYSNSPLVFHS